MAVVTESIEVNSDAQTAWSKITDLDSTGEWMTVHVDYPEGAPEELSEGTSYKEKVTIMGMPGEVSWTVTAVEEPRKLELSGVGPMGTTLRALFEIAGNGSGATTITYETEFGGPALAAMEGPLTAASRKAADESLGKLKALLD